MQTNNVHHIKENLSDLLYVAVWSFGLLYASFRTFIEGTKQFMFSDLTLKEAVEVYVFPIVMAMILFLVDAIYTILKSKKNGCAKSKLFLSLFSICLVIFLGGFLASLMGENSTFVLIAFIVSWLFLTAMKFISIYFARDKVIPIGNIVNSD